MPEHKHSSGGDPNGRRVARQRAAFLEEANRVARALKILAERAQFPTADITALEKALTEQEQIQLLRAHGRIEPRKRFKNAPVIPLLVRRNIGTLYIDESGTSGVEKGAGPHFFALGAVAISPKATKAYQKAADLIKIDFFGRNFTNRS